MAECSLAELFSSLGASYVFGMPADSVNGVYQHLNTAKHFHLQHVYNEKVAACAAVLFNKLTQSPAICVATAGPGVGHVLQAAAFAKDVSARVFFVAGLSAEEEYPDVFQPLNIRLFCDSIDIPFIDLRMKSALDANKLFSDGPVFIGVSALTRVSKLHVESLPDMPSGSLVQSAPIPSCEPNLPARVLSENLARVGEYPDLSHSVLYLKSSLPLPSGWGAAALLLGRLFGSDLISEVMISEHDLLESFADSAQALLGIRIKVRLYHIAEKPRIEYEKLVQLCPTLTVVPLSAKYYREPLAGLTILLTEQSYGELGFTTVESLAFQYGAAARLGSPYSLEINDSYIALASYNGIADQIGDRARIKGTVCSAAVSENLDEFWNDLFNPPKAGSGPISMRCSFDVAELTPPVDRLLVVVGSQALPYAEQIVEAAEQYGVPLACTLGSYWAFKDSRNYVGIVGSSGHFATERLRKKASLCVYLGVTNQGIAHDVLNPDFPHLDVFIDQQLPVRPFPTNSVRIRVDQVAALFQNQIPSGWNGRSDYHKVHQRIAYPGPTCSERLSSLRSKLSARQVIRTFLSHYDPERTLVYVDVGLNTLWSIRTIPPKYKVIWTRGFASMGSATFGGIGASKLTDFEIVVITGDGGFALASGEVLGSLDLAISYTVLVLDNGGLGAVRFEQEVFGYKPVGAYNVNSYLTAFGALMKERFYDINTLSDLTVALNEVEEKIRVFNVHVDPDEAPLPSRDISNSRRKVLIKSWVSQGVAGWIRALRTIPYIIDKWER